MRLYLTTKLMYKPYIPNETLLFPYGLSDFSRRMIIRAYIVYHRKNRQPHTYPTANIPFLPVIAAEGAGGGGYGDGADGGGEGRGEPGEAFRGYLDAGVAEDYGLEKASGSGHEVGLVVAGSLGDAVEGSPEVGTVGAVNQ